MREKSDYFSCFPIPFSLRYIVMLLSHMHIPCCICSIRLSTIIQARELLIKLFGRSTVDFLSLSLTFANLDLVSVVLHIEVVDKTVH